MLSSHDRQAIDYLARPRGAACTESAMTASSLKQELRLHIAFDGRGQVTKLLISRIALKCLFWSDVPTNRSESMPTETGCGSSVRSHDLNTRARREDPQHEDWQQREGHRNRCPPLRLAERVAREQQRGQNEDDRGPQSDRCHHMFPMHLGRRNTRIRVTEISEQRCNRNQPSRGN